MFSPKKPNANYVLKALTKALGVKVSTLTLNKNLEDHPDYPNLASLADCLKAWKIENTAYLISKKDYKASEMNFPFIAHYYGSGGKYVLVEKIENSQVYFSDEDHDNGIISETEFIDRWDGIILHAEKVVESGEKDYQLNQLKYLLHMLIIPACILLFLAIISITLFSQPFNWAVLSLVVIKTLGLVISLLLLLQSVNADNLFIKNLCSLGGKNDCNTILRSDAAKVTSWLSWSEVGFFYFTASLLALLIVPSSFTFLAWLNIFSLPYILYSIGYQYVNKNWCILCCGIQMLLFLEFLAFKLSKTEFFVFNDNLSSLLLLPLIFVAPILAWAFLKPIFLKAKEYKQLKQQLNKFKYNSVLFQQALTNQPRYTIGDELMPIVLGNPQAETVITLVSNPFCTPCAKAHQTLSQWIQTRNDLQLKLIFTSSEHNNNDKSTIVARHLIALGLHKSKMDIENALHDWYMKKTERFENWANKYPIIINSNVESAFDKQQHWCNLAHIKFTPTILVNGYKLPIPYVLEDLKYLLD